MADVFGDKLKNLEMIEAGRKALPNIPIIARLDGRAFHTFTRGLPAFDERMAHCMLDATFALVSKFHPLVGYTQSDEITLVWDKPTLFDGRFQKYTSVLAGFCSAVFFKNVSSKLPKKANQIPHFDCRVWSVPSLQDAYEVLLWREDDATKNSIAMLAQEHFSHKELQGKGRRDMLDMLHAKGINWNEMKPYYKRGAYIKQVAETRVLSYEERMRIPAAHRPAPETSCTRNIVQLFPLEPLRKEPNAMVKLFGKSE